MNPFPPEIETERLIIRTPQENDAPALNEAILETFEQLNLWMPWAIERPSLQDSVEVCARMCKNTQDRKDFALFAFDKHTHEFVLATGCHPRNLEVPSFEIGYWCRSSKQGNGYVTESTLAIAQTTFYSMGAKRIEIRCDDRNIASQAVARRCGFILDGMFKNDCRDNQGHLRNTLVFSQVRS